jgi:hypothetical protein
LVNAIVKHSIESKSTHFSTATKRANPTFAQAGITPTGDVELLRSWYVVVGEQMINEETIEMEEAKMATEQEAWERLHQAIFRELFPQNRKANSSKLRDAKSVHPHWAHA